MKPCVLRARQGAGGPGAAEMHEHLSGYRRQHEHPHHPSTCAPCSIAKWACLTTRWAWVWPSRVWRWVPTSSKNISPCVAPMAVWTAVFRWSRPKWRSWWGRDGSAPGRRSAGRAWPRRGRAEIGPVPSLACTSQRPACRESLTPDNLRAIRPGQGVATKYLELFMGRAVRVDVKRAHRCHGTFSKRSSGRRPGLHRQL